MSAIFRNRKIYDISITLGAEAAVYPGDVPFRREAVSSVLAGDASNVSKLTLSAHSGTHIDAPSHFLKHAAALDALPVESFILPALVVNIAYTKAVLLRELRDLEVAPGSALLFRTNSSRTGRSRKPRFSKEYAALSPSAALFCVEKKVSLVGIDYLSVDMFGDERYPVHLTLLRQGILILEGIDLKEVPPGEYTLICLPLKMEGAEASPVRAVLVDN